MKLTINPALEAEAEKFADHILEAFSNSTVDSIEGFAYSDNQSEIKADTQTLEAFKAGAKHLQSTDFAKDILRDFRDERERL